MAKSALASKMDEVLLGFSPLLREAGFRKRGRTYNRVTPDGLVHVVGFQMGRFEPPGTTEIPGFRGSLYGSFAVNFGIYVPEVAHHHGGGEARSVVREYDCCIRARLGQAKGEDIWWRIFPDENLTTEVSERLRGEAFPLFERLQTRVQVVQEARSEAGIAALMPAPRVVCAIILLHLGQREDARRLLIEQAQDASYHPSHTAYVIALARQLGVEIAS